MKIEIKCSECGSEDIYIDDKRQGIWCNGCGEIEQIQFREYDWREE